MDDGTLLADIFQQNRQTIGIDKIPKTLQNATVAIEDNRFWTNNSGFDIRGIGRAMWRDVVGGDEAQGGSTITQQLVRNLGIGGLTMQKTYSRKIREIIYANQIERNYSKQQILEMYMNAVAHNMDPHSSYLSPRQSEEYRIQMSLSYDGIGASLQLEDDYVKVMNIIAGGPAQADGRLKEEDRITAVGEGSGELVDVIGWRLDDVVQKIRGPGGTRVRLQVLPAGAAPGVRPGVLPAR